MIQFKSLNCSVKPPKNPETEQTFSSLWDKLNITREVMKGHGTTKGQHHTNQDFKTTAIANDSQISLLNILPL